MKNEEMCTITKTSRIFSENKSSHGEESNRNVIIFGQVVKIRRNLLQFAMVKLGCL